MVQINGENFEIYDLDTEISILNRIASTLNTLPKYLYFPDKTSIMEQFNTDKNIIVEDILLKIKNDKNFTNLYNDIKNKILLSNIILDLIHPFIAYIETEDLNNNYINNILELIQIEIKTLNIAENLELENIWISRNDIINNLENAIETNRIKTFEQLTYFESIKNAVELKFTPFELEKDKNELILEFNNITLMEVFNYVKLNTNVPFGSLNNFYKILKDFIPYEEWSFTTEHIILMVSPAINSLSNSKINDYSTIIIEEVQDKKEVIIHFYYNKSVNNLNKDKFIERIIDIFPKLKPLNIKSLNSDSINGVFYFPEHNLNKNVLSDLIMNNPLFSSILSINESVKATKSRVSIYVYFNHINTGPITATITEKTMTRNDPNMKDKDFKVFPTGKKYIRVKIKNSKNMEAIQEFQKIFSKLMTLYDEEYPKIVQIYKEYIPFFGDNDFLEEEVKEEEESIFPPTYSRSCTNIPTVITTAEQERQAIENGKQIMSFPRNQDSYLATPKKYICNYSKNIYPSLKENTDPATKDKFPLLPCCYGNDPKNPKSKLHSKYRVYYGLEKEQEKKQLDTQQNLIKTNKFVNFKIFGFLPKNINRLFNIINTDNQYEYIRTGVFNTKSSFLNCVLLAIGDQTVQSLNKVEEIEVFLANFRESSELLSPELISACKQEMYDYTNDEISDIIRDSTIYFDPKLFIHLLEVKYKCNIFLFSRDESNNDKMILPRHIQSYQKIKNNYPCIFIYEHIGSESDQTLYPRCELIVKSNKSDPSDIIYTFEHNNIIYKKINQVYNNLRESYSLNILNEENDFPLVGLQQKIDSYGKVRMINIKYFKNIIPLITTPMQPTGIPEITEETVSKIDADIAIKFANRVKMVIFGQTVIKGKIKEIFGTIGNVKVSIPVVDRDPFPNIQQYTKSLNYVENNISTIETYNKNKKLARYIIEYMFWLYSKFLIQEENKLVPERMIAFANQYILIDPLFEYKNVPKTFSEESGVMYNRKLVVKSQETLKRLLYVLRLEVIRNPQKILEYYKRNNIENFYIDITDFDQYQSQVILQGEDSIKKWSNERKVNYTLHNDILLGDSPYFFKNKIVAKNKLFICQNTNSIEKAIAIAKTWYENGYNPTTNIITETDLVEFTLYAFGNLKNIKKYSIKGLKYPQNIKILGYNINNKSYFTVLLSIFKINNLFY